MVVCLQGGDFSLKTGKTYVNTENFSEVLIWYSDKIVVVLVGCAGFHGSPKFYKCSSPVYRGLED